MKTIRRLYLHIISNNTHIYNIIILYYGNMVLCTCVVYSMMKSYTVKSIEQDTHAASKKVFGLLIYMT